jgi:hypothetical protein
VSCPYGNYFETIGYMLFALSIIFTVCTQNTHGKKLGSRQIAKKPHHKELMADGKMAPPLMAHLGARVPAACH